MTTPPVLDYVFPLADEADLRAGNLARIADRLAPDDPVMADNLRRASERLQAALAAAGLPVSPLRT